MKIITLPLCCFIALGIVACETAPTPTQGLIATSPTWVRTLPIRPSDWTSVEQAKNALRLCNLDLHSSERYGNVYGYRKGYNASPEWVDRYLNEVVFKRGWDNAWAVPVSVPGGAEDIWAFGYSMGCWDGPQKFPLREKPIWSPYWAQNP